MNTVSMEVKSFRCAIGGDAGEKLVSNIVIELRQCGFIAWSEKIGMINILKTNALPGRVRLYASATWEA